MYRLSVLLTESILVPALLVACSATPACWGQVVTDEGTSTFESPILGSSSSDSSNDNTETILVGFLVVVVAVLVILGIRSDFSWGKRAAQPGSQTYAETGDGPNHSDLELTYGLMGGADPAREERGLELTAVGLRARF